MRIGLLATLLFFSLASQAKDYSGFYLGLAGGTGNFNGKPEYTTMTLDMGERINSYGGFIGYKTIMGVMSFALELDYLKHRGEAEVAINSLNIGVKAEQDYTYAGSILVGYLAAETVELFLRAGYGKTKIKTFSGSLTSPTERNDSVGTGHAGLGIRFSNESNLGLRLEYRYLRNEDYKMVDGSDFKSDGDLFLASVDYMF